MLPDISSESNLTKMFEGIESAPDVESAILGVRDHLGIDHVVYNVSSIGTDPTVKPYVRLTYPSDWVKRYVLMDYASCDPVLRRGFSTSSIFQWSDLVLVNEEELRVIQDAMRHGIGPHGLSIPVTSKLGHRGLFSISYSGPLAAWDRFRILNLKAVVDIANKVHRRVLAEEFGELKIHLSPREIECLRWIARGKEAYDVALILNISVHTVRDYLKSARFKLESATIAQAVSKAIQQGMIFS